MSPRACRSVYALKRWYYEPETPRLPGLEIGFVPIAQMLILSPVAFAVASRLAPRQHRRKEQ